MTEVELEIQDLRRENKELKGKVRNLMAKNDKLTEQRNHAVNQMQTAEAECIKLRRQVQALMGWDME